MKVYYKVSHVRWFGSAGRGEYDERSFFVEKSLEDYVHYMDLRRELFSSTASVDEDWYVDFAKKRLYKRYFSPVKEEEFAEWYLERCANDREVSSWDLRPLDGSVVSLRFFKDHAVEFLCSRKTLKKTR